MQHSIFKNAFLKAFTFAVLFLSAFKTKAGGDVYEIYLNSKLIAKQFVTQPLNIKDLQLDRANSNDRLVIIYNHCGQTGKGRTIAIKDDKGKVLREWKFADAKGSDVSMVIPVKELLTLAKNYSEKHLTLYYAAQQLPKGRLLTSVNLENKNVSFYHADGRLSRLKLFAGTFFNFIEI
ncbi:MAG: hypothetical protein ABJA90_05885 [Ginsengibacter sp.]